ncbi:shikimate kinase I [Lentilactobacillus farraginis DSM 18382 = JCM 14108]|uniref:Shikimate kinase I n=1 Tax=Lentilactobacillus farraginis DSM 18382 = JCM 14108 TaxID=1423743 RepID=X0PHE1_9LACO|nr:shikimate kinase I [Lentilactobacillus farraginis DSM 18382 = JCM 14108]
MMRAILVGFMGSGKTTVGRLLANQIQVPYHDLDDVIVHRTGKSIQQIFDDEGEATFRMLEHDALMNSLGDEGILGTGAGHRFNRLILNCWSRRRFPLFY